MLKPIWDGDVLRYQCGFAAESYWKMIHEERWEHNEIVMTKEESEEFFLANPPPFDIVQDMLEDRIANTHAIIGTTEEPVFYFTGKGNFRNDICTTGYKNRAGRKPFHYKNIDAYLKGRFNCITVDGIEADDALAIEGSKDPENTIIIGIDKDLLQVPCWHYLFEYGNVPSFGPHKVEGYGRIWQDGKKLRGYGNKFFLAQCIMGDPVDSIIGIPKSGPVAALKALGHTNTYLEGLEAVIGAYRAFYGDEWIDKLVENARLLWMVRELDEDNKPVMWRIDVNYN
jgi:hypothetical protein